MTLRLSRTLHISTTGAEPRVVCAACSYALGPNGEPWKPEAILAEEQMNRLGVDAYAACADEVVLRRFTCPECATLLDTEVAVAGDPFLDDVLAP